MRVSVSCSVMSDSLRPHGLLPTRLFCPWNSSGKNTGVGSHPFSRGSSRPRDQTWVSHIAGGFFSIWAIRESHQHLHWSSFFPVYYIEGSLPLSVKDVFISHPSIYLKSLLLSFCFFLHHSLSFHDVSVLQHRGKLTRILKQSPSSMPYQIFFLFTKELSIPVLSWF